VKSSIDSKQQY